MAVVPRYTPQAETAPLPGRRVGAQASPQDFGNGMVREAGAGFRDLQEIAAQEEARADQLAALDFDNRLAEAEKSLTAEAYQKKGRDALGEPERVMGEYDKLSSQAMSVATTPRQRELFLRRAQARRIGIGANIERHVFAERQRYETEVRQTAWTNAAEAAINNHDDPTRLDNELVRGKTLVAQQAYAEGADVATANQRAQAYESGVWLKIIGNHLDAGDDRAAAALYAERKDYILPSERGRVEKALEVRSTEGEAQRRTDEMMPRVHSIAQLNEELGKIEDVKIRDATSRRARQAYAAREAARDEDHRAAVESAHRLVRDGVRPDQFNQELRERLKPADLDAFDRRAAQVERREQPAKNSERYYFLRTLAATAPEEFKDAHLLRHAHEIDDAQLSQLIELQADMRGKKPMSAAARAEWVGVNTAEDIVNQTLAGAGYDPRPTYTKDGTTKTNEPAIAFRRELDRHLESWASANGGKKPGPDVVRQVAEALMVEETFRMTDKQATRGAGSWFKFDGTMVDGKRRRFEVPGLALSARDVPAQRMDQVRAALVAEGRQPTEDAIVRRYNAWLALQAKP